MKLEDFVSETLTAIIRGAVKAQETLPDHRASINPTGRGGVSGRSFNATPIQDVTFDVAVSAAESVQAGGGINVLGVGLSLGASGSDSTSTVSRIQFVIPVGLPVGHG